MIGSNRLLPRVLIQVLPVTVVVLLAIGYFAHLTVRQSALDVDQKRLEQITAQSSASLAVTLRNVVDMAHTLAANDLVINSLIDMSDRERYIPTLFQSLRVPGSNRARITLNDYRGRHIASNTSGPDHKDEEWVAAVLKGRDLIRTGVDGMLVAVPVYQADLAEGMVVIEFDTQGFADLVKLPIQADGYAITTTDGRAIFASDATLLSAARSGTDSDTWMTVSTALESFPNLRLVTGDRMATVLEPIERQSEFLLAAILLSIAAVGVGVFITAIKVVKPIQKFIRGVEKVSGSNGLKYRMEPFGAEEFQHLTGSFNEMLGDIESTTTSRDYTDGILNSMTEFMLVVSADGKVQSGNRAMARALGCRVRDLPGRHVSSLVSGAWQEIIVLAAKDGGSVERSLTTGVNSDVPVLVSASPMRSLSDDSDQPDDEGPELLILVLKDITEQIRDKALLDKHVSDLERSNADLEQFAYVASHDLKAPLRAIDNLAGWIEEDVAEHMTDDSREHMTLLRGRVGRLESLLEGLLRYARAGRDDTELSWVDTGSLVSDAVELLGEPEHVRVDIPENMPRLHTSAAALQQVFRNLIGNAVKHRDRDDVRVEIAYRDCGSLVEFSVADDGPGIPEQYHDRIFQMFQTLKRRDEVEGSGLGLAMVRKLVRTHAGEISVESGEGERGTIFRFTWANEEADSSQKIQMEGKNAA